ncbi:hypothetical protein OIU74_015092 [Salix koriyanagi]|uniref:Uncharacterized protein n=1 Tax=Salix koriyanagi TaxID=2511006 RepID=A0A9Q0T0F5_9ROSI|nr:hypothetical protein OIU74_015092 [Salix koriyanagi]
MVFAISTEEPTRTGYDPNLTCMMGAIFLGEGMEGNGGGSSPMRLRFPIIGQDFWAWWRVELAAAESAG